MRKWNKPAFLNRIKKPAFLEKLKKPAFLDKIKMPAFLSKIKLPAFIERMSKPKKIILGLLLSALVLSLFYWWTSHIQLGRKLWYLLPSAKEYYIYVPTDYAPEELEDSTLTVTRLTGFGEKKIVGEYWQEQSCFHAIVEDRGIYRISLSDPGGPSLTVFVEIGRDQIYSVPYYRGPVLPDPDIPEDKLEWNGHQYWIVTTKYDWNVVNSQLERIGAHLATISSPEENEAIYGYLTEKGIATAFFGLYDPDGTQNWCWVTGEPLDYTNWSEGEPNDPSECYGQFYSKSQPAAWNNAHAPAADSIYICEKDSLE